MKIPIRFLRSFPVRRRSPPAPSRRCPPALPPPLPSLPLPQGRAPPPAGRCDRGRVPPTPTSSPAAGGLALEADLGAGRSAATPPRKLWRGHAALLRQGAAPPRVPASAELRLMSFDAAASALAYNLSALL
jgi:hypothetical protein